MTQASKGLLSLKNISPKVINVDYGMSKVYAKQAQLFKKGTEANKKFAVPDIIQSNTCNPHLHGQKALTFNRQVLSAMLDPALLKSEVYHKDVRDRADFYLRKLNYPLGAYSEDIGYRIVKRHVANFLEKRDGLTVDPDNVFLTDGVSSGMNIVMKILVNGPNDGILIPAPYGPLYSGIITVHNASRVPYYLKEDNGWRFDFEALQRTYDEGKRKGLTMKAICVTNPGNPIGNVLTEAEMKQIVDFAYKNKLIILADEVLQDTAYNKKFISFKKVVASDPSRPVDLFSFYSASNPIYGEGGYRAGLFEVHNLDPEVHDHFKKLKTMHVCSNTVGQIMVDLLVNPPTNENASRETVQKYENERTQIFNALKSKAKIVSDAVKNMKNTKATEIEGGIYAFPKVQLSQKAITEAGNKGVYPEELYCLEALEQIGLPLEPGHAFGQEAGSYHYRISAVLYPEQTLKQKMEEFDKFNNEFHKKYN